MSAESRTLTISEALSELREEFPDVTISKIRFLEGQGLIEPERNASGYRQFRDSDVQRLVWILRQQRDKFLPLKVIKRALDRGVDIHDAGDGAQPNLFSAVADAAASEEQAAEEEARATEGDKRRHPAGPVGQSAEPVGRSSEPAGSAMDGAPAERGGVSAPGTVPGVGEGPAAAAEPSVAPEPPAIPASSKTSPDSSTGESHSQSEEGTMPAGPVSPKRHSTPADVVAALQEDPRPTQKPQPRQVRQQRPALALGDDDSAHSFTAEELVQAAGISMEMLEDLERYGLVEAVMHGAEVYYDQHCLRVASLAAAGAERGIEARHLRMYKVAAEREAGFIEQLVMPLLKQRNPESRARALEEAVELAALGAEMHAAVLARELHPDLARKPSA